jgi:hypothetical protein
MVESDDILTADEMQAWYGPFYDQSPGQRLDSSRVPQELRLLLPYAEFWGILDDWSREDLVAAAPVEVRKNLATIVTRFGGQFDDWLAGPEADSEVFSDEYVAFSALRMAADFAELDVG